MATGYDAICFGTDFRRATPSGGTEVTLSITAPDAIVLSPATATLGSPLLNAKILRRDFVTSAGEFDLTYKIASDAEFLLRLALANPRVAVLPVVGHHYLEHAGSLTINAAGNNGRRAAQECIAIADATLARPGLPRGVRSLMRALRGGKTIAIARMDRKSQPGRAMWSALVPAWADIVHFSWYLVGRKLRRIF